LLTYCGHGGRAGTPERKKRKTRELIAETARQLFAERGSSRSRSAEIAREAEVSPATVFNYFPTKEDLFYSRLEAFEDELMTAIRERAAGQSVVDVFAGFLLGQGGVLTMDAPEADEQLRTITRIITESPALLAPRAPGLRSLRPDARRASCRGDGRKARRLRPARRGQRAARAAPRADRPGPARGARRHPGREIRDGVRAGAERRSRS
jgi:AcrR family transcriptional regulator